jgi:hypothetical protein
MRFSLVKQPLFIASVFVSGGLFALLTFSPLAALLGAGPFPLWVFGLMGALALGLLLLEWVRRKLTGYFPLLSVD